MVTTKETIQRLRSIVSMGTAADAAYLLKRVNSILDLQRCALSGAAPEKDPEPVPRVHHNAPISQVLSLDQ